MVAAITVSGKNGLEPRPFLRWAGGKDQLLEPILSLVPKRFNAYHEPFIGGGAVYFAMVRERRIKGAAYLSDLNHRLVTCYRMVRSRPQDVIDELERLMQERTLEGYLRARTEFNRGVRERRSGVFGLFTDSTPPSPIRLAALFVFLNRICFNGLFRENQKGEFNVSFDPSKVTADVVRGDVLLAASSSLQGAEILEADFLSSTSLARAGDFIFFDPPYVPVSVTASFDQYTADGFGMDHQASLAEACQDLAKRSINFLLCNSAHPAVLELYKGFEISHVRAIRSVNCKGTGRGAVDEVLIRNY